MRRRVITCLTMATVIMAVAVLLSGAPLRVYVAEAIALVVAFVIPSLFVGGLRELKRKWYLTLIAGLAGGVAWDVGAALTIAKVRSFELPLIYPAAVSGSTILLTTYATVLSAMSGREGVVQRGVASDDRPRTAARSLTARR